MTVTRPTHLEVPLSRSRVVPDRNILAGRTLTAATRRHGAAQQIPAAAAGKHRVLKNAIALVALSAGALIGGAGQAIAQTSGNFQETAVNVEPAGTSTVILTGVVNAVCTEGAGAFRPGPDNTFTIDTTTICPGGNLFATVAGRVVSFQIDPRTCVGQRLETSTTTFTGGTGIFAGASGSTNDTVRFTLLFARGPQGCQVDQPPLLTVEVLRLQGTLNLPS